MNYRRSKFQRARSYLLDKNRELPCLVRAQAPKQLAVGSVPKPEPFFARFATRNGQYREPRAPILRIRRAADEPVSFQASTSCVMFMYE